MSVAGLCLGLNAKGEIAPSFVEMEFGTCVFTNADLCSFQVKNFRLHGEGMSEEKVCPDFHEEAIKYWTPYNTKVK